MNRKQFLKNCALGVCSCAAVAVPGPAAWSAAETAKSEDWRLRFVKQRYGRLLEILSRRMSETALNETLFELGNCCSAFGDDTLQKFRGDLEGYRRVVKQSASADNITYDWEKGVITMASDERTDCFCPLISRFHHAPPVACQCSLGWQQHTWETLLQKSVRVELKESVLRGGKRCVFVIHVGDRAASSPGAAAG
ncbi:MAG TPA: hypothetical protein VLW52_03605 [Opitutaceae bacterium]|nr:hypothetical protein [Opitutaceae bacterium]